MDIQYTPRFVKQLKKLPEKTVDKASYAEMIFQSNPLARQLKTHPLKGKLKGLYSFSVDNHYRIVFCFEEDGSVTFIDIGTHRIYR